MRLGCISADSGGGLECATSPPLLFEGRGAGDGYGATVSFLGGPQCRTSPRLQQMLLSFFAVFGVPYS